MRRVRRGRRRRRSRLAVAGVLAASVLLAGASGALLFAGSGSLQPDTSPSSLSSAPPAGEGELRTLDGSIVSVAGPRQRPLVAFFFAGWCASCIAEARALGQLHDALGDRVDIVAVSIDPNETAESLAAFRQAAGNPAVLWAIDATGATARRYKVQALDQTVVVNDAGRVVYEDFTPTSYEQLVKAVEKAF